MTTARHETTPDPAAPGPVRDPEPVPVRDPEPVPVPEPVPIPEPAPGPERDPEPAHRPAKPPAPAAPPVPGTPGPARRRGARRRGTSVVICSAALALLLALAGHVGLPELPGHLGSLAETLLPWTALGVPALAAPALLRGSRTATASLLLPVTAWLTVFGGTLTDKSSAGGDLTLVSHNVNQANPDPRGTARSLIAARADVVALQELDPDTAPAYAAALADAYPYHFSQGTVGLWSTRPLRDARAVPIMPWTRAMRATVVTPEGPLAVYVAHLPSVRVGPSGFTAGTRNEVVDVLAGILRAERAPRLVVMGDFNGSTDDRALRPLTRGMTSVQAAAGEGFGFTWPSRLPLVRIDQILLKGARATAAWTLPATPSDHLPVAARIRLDRAPRAAAGP
ncbi:endonuclease/exonuclease/phosphatase family protein [Streptomyces sp. NPDC058052]|uniref:endonuclease/exonuclease/phosphatase family protein n=1 Tax=Streptomyces sp. NPDC058052 TaxID=3346316 RepID=UPI0036EA9582